MIEKGDRITVQFTGVVRQVLRGRNAGRYVLRTDRGDVVTNFDPDWQTIVGHSSGVEQKTQNVQKTQ